MQSTITIDETLWPVLVLSFGGEVLQHDVEYYTAALERALDRGEPFGVVMVASLGYLESKRNNEAANKAAKWLKAHKSRMSTQCIGIATVIADDAWRKTQTPVTDQQAEKIYGCPIRTFATLEEAQSWLHEHLQVVYANPATTDTSPGSQDKSYQSPI